MLSLGCRIYKGEADRWVETGWFSKKKLKEENIYLKNHVADNIMGTIKEVVSHSYIDAVYNNYFAINYLNEKDMSKDIEKMEYLDLVNYEVELQDDYLLATEGGQKNGVDLDEEKLLKRLMSVRSEIESRIENFTPVGLKINKKGELEE